MLRYVLLAAVALAVAPGARADAPKAQKVDLEELKHALKVADKRGDNVGAIRDALAAFEKALAKGAIKPGEAPPELTALRAAVEAAFKKGENVEAISKELGAIEKQLTGSAYVRPKPVDPKVEEPKFIPSPGGFGGGGVVIVGGGGIAVAGGGGGIAINGGGFNMLSVSISDGQFTIKARQGAVSYTITGSPVGTEKPKIIIQDGDKKTEYDDVKKVPESHRPTVEKLLGGVGRG